MIRYNKELVNEINKTVRNYNAKISRLQKINPSLALPEKVTARSIKNISNSRKDLNKTLASLKRFSKRGAEDTIVLPSGDFISNYELGELKRESARLQRNLTRRINELADITPKVAGVKKDYTYAEMGDMRLNNMIAKRDTLKRMSKSITKGGDLKNFIKLLETTKNKQNYQISIFKNNYIDKMLTNQAYAIGYDSNRINEIKAKLNKLSDKDFLRFFDEEKVVQMVRDKYVDSTKLSGDAYFSYEEEMRDIFNNLYENMDEYLKDYPSYNA